MSCRFGVLSCTFWRWAGSVALAACTVTGSAAERPIRYSLSFPDAQNHYAEIEAVYPTDGRPSVELMMAVWTPGSYLVREYSRHVEEVRATAGGRALSVEKTTKNRWRVDSQGLDEIRVSYRVYCREMSVRTNWVERDFAVLNGAATFLTLADDSARPHEVRLSLPTAWSTSVTALAVHGDGASHHYVAADFDTLLDSPIVLGNPVVHEFEVSGVPHRLANLGGAPFWQEEQSALDTEKIVRETHAFWRTVPHESYVFLNVINESGGGLEHKSSTLMMTSRWRARDPTGYRRWLGLVSHEYFHAWNVKRLRPAALDPFDYETENYTRSLWVGEGLTSYYDNLLLRRAGLLTQKQYFEALGKEIERLQTTPGRSVQPVEEASYDAWIKHYRRDENTPNTTVSYYTKGAVVGFVLDARIRRLTSNERSLDDVMREAYRRFSGERGFTPEEFRRVVSDVTGQDQGAWLRQALQTTEELDYSEALEWYGLRFEDPEEVNGEEKQASNGDEEPKSKAWLGLTSEDRAGRELVTQVKRETPAFEHGLNVGDEVIALDGFRVPAGKWKERLKQYRPGDSATLLVARRERLIELPITFGEDPGKRWQLELHPDATPEQGRNLTLLVRSAATSAN